MVYDIADSKAIMGALFINYLIYAVFYSIDAIKLGESKKADDGHEDPNVKRT